jgi:hypothetical protein
MRKHQFDYLAKGEGFDPLIVEAAAQVRKPKMDGLAAVQTSTVKRLTTGASSARAARWHALAAKVKPRAGWPDR